MRRSRSSRAVQRGGQSVSLQHAPIAMHAPLQSVKPVLHAKPHVTPLQWRSR